MGTAGYQCVLYASTHATPDDEIAKAKDVELSASGNAIDISTRDGNGWKEFVAGLKEWEVTVDQLWVGTDAGLQALRDAFLAGTLMYVKLVDAAGYGFSGTCYLTSMKRGEPLDGAVVLPVSLKGTGALAVVTP